MFKVEKKYKINDSQNAILFYDDKSFDYYYIDDGEYNFEIGVVGNVDDESIKNIIDFIDIMNTNDEYKIKQFLYNDDGSMKFLTYNTIENSMLKQKIKLFVDIYMSEMYDPFFYSRLVSF